MEIGSLPVTPWLERFKPVTCILYASQVTPYHVHTGGTGNDSRQNHVSVWRSAILMDRARSHIAWNSVMHANDFRAHVEEKTMMSG